ncbi:hypothetical protein [Glycomyces xiaoerkulensis]|uniref:hypothetical protein n=1 Tax=Glycomyces xiaoerkulensis TaxID=2038139 RepID=UPI000C2627D5|nr:hypothetical protein [Glycomyces xiaoerkulensis]
MDGARERTLTDADEQVTLRLGTDGSVAVELSDAGLGLRAGDLARRIVELAAHLPAPDDADRRAVADGADAVARLQRTMASGGFEAFDDAMRRRLGIEAPPAPTIRSSEHDATLAAALGATLDHMRRSAEPPARAAGAEATATTADGDVSVTTGTERIITAVRIRGRARRRGAAGLGRTLTELLARARTRLGERTRITMDPAESGERAGRAGSRIIDRATEAAETLRRKEGNE